MGALGPLDAAVVLADFAGIALFGASFAKYARSTRDFDLAGQRLPAWLVAFSLPATTVGSYSFVKYASAGYRFGLASSQTYLNDWFWMPLFLFGCLPVAYRTGVLSVPEYFRRRFDERVGLAAAGVLLLYHVGYIGINLFTMGCALEAPFGIRAFWMALAVAALVMVYEASGGETSVVFTDYVRGLTLLAEGCSSSSWAWSGSAGSEAFSKRSRRVTGSPSRRSTSRPTSTSSGSSGRTPWREESPSTS